MLFAILLTFHLLQPASGLVLVNKRATRHVCTGRRSSDLIDPLGITFGCATVALGAGLLQYSMYAGERGLGSFLKDGKGYSKSSYSPLLVKDNKYTLKWLKLPRFDYVEVYGEDDSSSASDSFDTQGASPDSQFQERSVDITD